MKVNIGVDEILTWVNVKTWEELQIISRVVYERQISERIIIQVSQIVEDIHRIGRLERSQFLVLSILDEVSRRWICLRLSTVRKIWKVLVKKGFDTARRLEWYERMKVKHQDKEAEGEVEPTVWHAEDFLKVIFYDSDNKGNLFSVDVSMVEDGNMIMINDELEIDNCHYRIDAIPYSEGSICRLYASKIDKQKEQRNE